MLPPKVLCFGAVQMRARYISCDGAVSLVDDKGILPLRKGAFAGKRSTDYCCVQGTLGRRANGPD